MISLRRVVLSLAALIGCVSCGDDSKHSPDSRHWFVGEWTIDGELAGRELPPLKKPFSEMAGAEKSTDFDFYWFVLEETKKFSSPLLVHGDYTADVKQRNGSIWKWRWTEVTPSQVHLKLSSDLPSGLPTPEHWFRREGDRIRQLPQERMSYKYEMPMRRR